jgi:hypothetical protein
MVDGRPLSRGQINTKPPLPGVLSAGR